MKGLGLLTAILVLTLVGCVSTYIIPTGKDTYKIARHAPAFFWGTPYGTEKIVYEEANKLCAKDKKQVVTINLEVTNQFPAHSGGVSLEFRCE
ncbi:MAG TPA: hypothetical protein ENH34_07575 [Phycisphaerales bacterium]|nr:hypothetical protein [Phycisphaerales bacterium]